MNTPVQTHSVDVQQLADLLFEARRTRSPIAPLSSTFGVTGVELAYQTAALNTARHAAAGHRVVGRKIGLTSEAVQRQLGVDQPDFGVLFDDMEYLSGAEVPMGRLIQPKVEAEIAFIVGRDLPASPPSWSEFLRCIDYAVPSLEIVDSAIADWKITLFDTIADNASSAAFVMGDQPVSIGHLDLANIDMRMERSDETVSSGIGSACLGHPLRAAYWLACTVSRLGEPLRAGEVILSGALGPMVPLTAGDSIVATFGGMGSVTCRMV